MSAYVWYGRKDEDKLRHEKGNTAQNKAHAKDKQLDERDNVDETTQQ